MGVSSSREKCGGFGGKRDRREGVGGSRTSVSGVFSVMALGHNYCESPCNAKEWSASASGVPT